MASVYDPLWETTQSRPLPKYISANPGSGQHRTTSMRSSKVATAAAHSVFGAVPPSDSTRALQTFLANQGFRISVDGIRGPQTNAAVQAYHNGINPKLWNARSQHAASPTRGPAPVVRPGRATPPGRSIRTAPTVSGRPGPAIPAGIAPSVGGGAGASGAPAAGGGDSIDAQAQAMVDAEFGPQIAAMERAMAQAQAQAQQQAAYLGHAYGEVADVATQAGGATANANQTLLQGQDTANQNMVNLFGGPTAMGSPAGEAAAFADINRGELAGLASSQQAFDTQMPAVIKTQGANAQQQTLAAAQAQIADMANQLTDLHAQRGQALAKTAYDLRQQDLQNQAAQQELDLARSLAPSKIAEANANATKAKVEAAWAPKLAAQQAQAFGMSKSRAAAELAQTQARTKAILASMNPQGQGIDLTDPNTRGSLAGQLRPIVQTKAGTWRMHPGAAQQNLNIALQQLGMANNPQARQIANSILQETVNNSHARKMWGQFNYANGKIVKTGKRFNPKKK